MHWKYCRRSLGLFVFFPPKWLNKCITYEQKVAGHPSFPPWPAQTPCPGCCAQAALVPLPRQSASQEAPEPGADRWWPIRKLSQRLSHHGTAWAPHNSSLTVIDFILVSARSCVYLHLPGAPSSGHRLRAVLGGTTPVAQGLKDPPQPRELKADIQRLQNTALNAACQSPLCGSSYALG